MNRRDMLKMAGVAIISAAVPIDLRGSPVPGGWIHGHLTNKGKLIPKVTWACDGIVTRFDNYNCLHIRLECVWGDQHIDYLKNLGQGDDFAVGDVAFSHCRKLVGKKPCRLPKVGDSVRITCERYLTDFGADGLAYVGKIQGAN